MKLESSWRSAGKEPVWRPMLLFLIVVAVSAGALYAYQARNFRFLETPDAMRYASVAREFWRGNGFAWRQYWPVELAQSGYDAAKTSPQFLHPLVISLLFRVMGERDLTVVVASMIPAALAAGLLFLLARRWFDDRVALVAALVFALNERTLYYGTSGLSEPLFWVLLLTCLLLLTRAERGRFRLLWLLLAGGVLGLAHAARPVGLYYLAAFGVVLLFSTRRRLLGVVSFCAGFALLMAVVALAGTGSLLPVGDPSVGLLTGVGDFANQYDVLRTIHPVNPVQYVVGHLTYYQAKLGSSLVHYAESLPTVIAGGSFLIGALFLMSLFARQKEGAVARMRLLLLLLIGAQLAVNVLFWPTDRYFVPFIPLVIVFAIEYLWRIVDRLIGRAVPKGDPA